MKKTSITLGSLFMSALLLAGAASCSSNEKETAKPAKAKTEAATQNLPNYRYVDVDSIIKKYNLAKDYDEELMRLQNNADSQIKQKESSINSFGTQVQNKMQNNGYLSEASLQQDQQKFAQMQQDYQVTANKLQNQIMEAQVKAMAAITDSIHLFIEEYNKSRGYDAIFNKAATLYINPELDITDEVIEGLNARYNKVKK